MEQFFFGGIEPSLSRNSNLKYNHMLQYEKDKCFVIYPSWAKVGYEWKDAERIFADPIGSGFMKLSDFRDPSLLESDEFRQYELISGNAGGGIITLPMKLYETGNFYGLACMAHFELVYFDRNNFIDGNAVPGIPVEREWPINVSYMTPVPNRLIAKFDKSFNQPTYVCWGAVQHVESAGDCVYAAIVTKGSAKDFEIRHKDYFIDLAAGFDMSLRYIGETPEPIKDEKPYWFTDVKNKYYWFALDTHPDGMNRCFAYLYYCALTLRKQMGKKMMAIVLAAQMPFDPKSSLLFLQKK